MPQKGESLVTQLKGNVTLVIASHNVNHPCGVAHAESRDRMICGIEVSPPLCHRLSCCTTQFSVLFEVIGCLNSYKYIAEVPVMWRLLVKLIYFKANIYLISLLLLLSYDVRQVFKYETFVNDSRSCRGGKKEDVIWF